MEFNSFSHFALMHLFWIFFWSSISRNSHMFVFFSNSCFTVKTFLYCIVYLTLFILTQREKRKCMKYQQGFAPNKKWYRKLTYCDIGLWDEVVAIVVLQQFQIDLPCLMWNSCFRSWLLFIRIDSSHLNFIMDYKIHCIINGGHEPTRENFKQK